MDQQLKGKRIAFVMANEGVEQVELTEPWKAVREAGGEPTLVATDPGKVQAFDHLDKADVFEVDLTTAAADPSAFDGVVLPGGVANPDQLDSFRDGTGDACRGTRLVPEKIVDCSVASGLPSLAGLALAAHALLRRRRA